jgi:hypothetical protein
MAKYRVRPGVTFGAGGKFKPGTVVELRPEDAAAFLDKLQLVTGEKPAPAAKAPTGKKSEAAAKPEAASKKGKDEKPTGAFGGRFGAGKKAEQSTEGAAGSGEAAGSEGSGGSVPPEG